ncbi:hypothetical protein [Paenibacillus faecalis]|uniref:hypothetical protein n=1 Tax=Paenibacillus faecalis TaxID=2079532 RepID=UPI000D11124B|nr:hypothetical protein [Paenibacillus faecalis]
MRRYNVWRPVMILGSALVTYSLVTNLSIMFGMALESAKNVGFIAMMVVALIVYNRVTKNKRKRR